MSGGDAVLLVDAVAVRAGGRDERCRLALLALDQGTGDHAGGGERDARGKVEPALVAPEKMPSVTRMLQAPTTAVPMPIARLVRAIARPATVAPIEIAKSIDVEVDDANAKVATTTKAPATASS